MFKKGHNTRGAGRKKNVNVRRNLTDNNTTGREEKRKEKRQNKNNAIDKFPINKEWDTTSRWKTLDPELVDYYIYNDLDVTELLDNVREYKEDGRN